MLPRSVRCRCQAANMKSSDVKLEWQDKSKETITITIPFRRDPKSQISRVAPALGLATDPLAWVGAGETVLALGGRSGVSGSWGCRCAGTLPRLRLREQGVFYGPCLRGWVERKGSGGALPEVQVVERVPMAARNQCMVVVVGHFGGRVWGARSCMVMRR